MVQLSVTSLDPFTPPTKTTPIGELRVRDRAAVEGTVTAVTLQPWAADTRALHVTVTDDTGSLTLAHLGRTSIVGVGLGTRVVVAGAVLRRGGRLMMMNPHLWLRPAPRPGERADPGSSKAPAYA